MGSAAVTVWDGQLSVEAKENLEVSGIFLLSGKSSRDLLRNWWIVNFSPFWLKIVISVTPAVANDRTSFQSDRRMDGLCRKACNVAAKEALTVIHPASV